MYLKIITLIVLIGVSAFFSLAEAALLSISRLRIRHLVDKKLSGSKELKILKENPHRLLITLLIGGNIANVSVSAIATELAIELFHNNALGIAIGVTTFLLLVFSDILPKSIAIHNNITTSLIVAKPIWFLSIILYPLIIVFDFILRILKRVFGLGDYYNPIITGEELKSIIKLGGEEGAIKNSEKDLIERIFRLDNILVKDIMTPKLSVISISFDTKLEEVLGIFHQHKYSRFPVYKNTRENIVGILVIKDMIKYVKEDNLDLEVGKVMRKARFVFETKKIDNLMWQFQKLKEHIAVVINERGKVVGIVTLEDVLEEIVGEIVDETERLKSK